MTTSKLGTDTDTGQLVYLPKTARTQGLYIIGIQGTGKSGLIENLILQDIDQQIGVCVLDPHGELIDHIIARLPSKTEEEKVIYLDLADYKHPFGLNLLECPDPTDDGEIVKSLYQVLHVFEKAYGIIPTTPLMYDLLYNTAYTLIANPGYTMIDIRLLLTNEVCRKKLAANVPNSDVQDFWGIWDDPKQTSQAKQEEKRVTILNKMNEFSHVPLRNIVGQSITTFRLQDIMDTGKILLVKLSRRLEQPSNLIGSIIIAQLLNAAYARPTTKRKQFHLYADEFQNFATEDFATLLEEARKFGIATTIAHQNRGQLNSANTQLETNLKDRSRSVGNMVVFKINSKDADDLAGEFNIVPPTTKTRLEPVRTPVMKPIQYSLARGTHPLPETRNFISIYGKELVEGARKEEEHERDYKRAVDEYDRAVALGHGAAVILPPPSNHYRAALDRLNNLFYQTMLDSKQGQNLDDSIDIRIALASSSIITASSFVPQSVKKYQELLYKFDLLVPAQELANPNIREGVLKKRLAELPAHRQDEITQLRINYIDAQRQFAQVLRSWMLAEIEAVRKHCVIVRKGSYFYYAQPEDREWGGPRPNAYYFRHAEYDLKIKKGGKYDFQKVGIDNLRYDHSNLPMKSFEDAIAFYCQVFRQLWFRVENTLWDKNWWEYQRSLVSCKFIEYGKGYEGEKETIVELDTWVPKQGIERVWVTEAVFEAKYNELVKAYLAQTEGVKTTPSYNPERDAVNTEINRWVINKRGYGEWSDAIMRQYHAYKALEKLKGEIGQEVKKEETSIQEELSLISQLQALKGDYEKFASEIKHQLRAVLHELAVLPIEEESGSWEEQPLVPRTYADVQNEIANSLVGLPNYTARVKIATTNGTVEHSIKTFEPEKGLYGKTLQERIVARQARNLQQGYLRDRTIVEAEIIQRQTACSGGSSPAQPQRPPQQPSPQLPRHARQVTVQGNCPNCGKTNSPGSQFCNQCGTKLT